MIKTATIFFVFLIFALSLPVRADSVEIELGRGRVGIDPLVQRQQVVDAIVEHYQVHDITISTEQLSKVQISNVSVIRNDPAIIDPPKTDTETVTWTARTNYISNKADVPDSCSVDLRRLSGNKMVTGWQNVGVDCQPND